MGILTINAQCSNLCYVLFDDQVHDVHLEHNGYVPNGIGIGGGDYLRLQIDTVIGRVLSCGLMTDVDIIEALEK